jgi:hypothetical protein
LLASPGYPAAVTIATSMFICDTTTAHTPRRKCASCNLLQQHTPGARWRGPNLGGPGQLNPVPGINTWCSDFRQCAGTSKAQRHAQRIQQGSQGTRRPPTFMSDMNS